MFSCAEPVVTQPVTGRVFGLSVGVFDINYFDLVQDGCVTPTSCTTGTGNGKQEFLLLRPGS